MALQEIGELPLHPPKEPKTSSPAAPPTPHPPGEPGGPPGPPAVTPCPVSPSEPPVESPVPSVPTPASASAGPAKAAEETSSAPAAGTKFPCPVVLVALCWLGATVLLTGLRSRRFDPAWLLLATPPPPTRARRWTLALLRDWLELQFGVSLSKETIRQALLRLNLSWKKARKLLARAQRAPRQAYLDEVAPLLAAAQRGELTLAYIDEAHIHLDVHLANGWAPVGQPLYIHSSSPGLLKVSFFGVYLLPYQAVRIWPVASANTDTSISALERLRQQFPDGPLVVIWDGASYHKSAELQAAAQRLQIQLKVLPPYSPDFMPVEALWRWLRQDLTTMHCHRSIAELIHSVASFVALINLAPTVLSARLRVRTSLDSVEEELRFSNWF